MTNFIFKPWSLKLWGADESPWLWCLKCAKQLALCSWGSSRFCDEVRMRVTKQRAQLRSFPDATPRHERWGDAWITITGGFECDIVRRLYLHRTRCHPLCEHWPSWSGFRTPSSTYPPLSTKLPWLRGPWKTSRIGFSFTPTDRACVFKAKLDPGNVGMAASGAHKCPKSEKLDEAQALAKSCAGRPDFLPCDGLSICATHSHGKCFKLHWCCHLGWCHCKLVFACFNDQQECKLNVFDY